MRSQACALKVKDLMTPSVVSVSPKESVEDAARLMTRFGISSLLVTDSLGVDGISRRRMCCSGWWLAAGTPRPPRWWRS